MSALTGSTHTDTTVAMGTRYTYYLAAVIDGGEFGRSAPVAVTAGASNQGPVAALPLADQQLLVGGSAVVVEVASGFRDADGDALTYAASSGQVSTATVSVSGSTVTVTPVAGGRSVITVTATDASGSNSSATQRFVATVGKDYDADGDGLIEITTLAQLDAMRHDLRGRGDPADASAYDSAFPNPLDFMGCDASQGCSGYELMADLDFDTNGSGSADSGDTYWNGGSGWLPIGEDDPFPQGGFNATFDGNGHTIANLFLSRESDSYPGLFRGIGNAGVVRDLNITDVAVTGSYRVGALAGVNSGRVIAVHVSGSVRGDLSVGGLAGFNWFSSEITRSRYLG
ncbi:MAG: hypothetical protein F4Y94_06515, partial [Chloroflexi bacterium]|nr:hypothetical protein [Chloroflexota bacterium]